MITQCIQLIERSQSKDEDSKRKCTLFHLADVTSKTNQHVPNFLRGEKTRKTRICTTMHHKLNRQNFTNKVTFRYNNL